ncbi:MAG: guanylate kinase [Burkholderiaceae bacterium]
MSKGSVFMVIAPSGAGKSSLVNALLAKDAHVRLSISHTTRPPRPAETDGKQYHFVDVPTFKKLRSEGEFLEWAEVHGNFYATSKRWIEEQTAVGEDVLLEIDWQGARQVKKRFTDAVGIFILPPSIEALEHRLRTRGQDSEAVIARRLLAAGSEIAHAPECEYVIINQDFSVALEGLEAIVQATRQRFSVQAARQPEVFAQLGIGGAGTLSND